MRIMNKTTAKIATISTLAATLLAATSCARQNTIIKPEYYHLYDASKIGAGALNKEKLVVKVEGNYSANYSEFAWGQYCYGILRPGHTYYFCGMFYEDHRNKDLAELVLGDDLTLKVLPKEKGESGIFPVPEGVDAAYIPTEKSNCPPLLEEIVWQPGAKIEYAGQKFWVKTRERDRDKYYGIKIQGYRAGDVSVEKREWSPEGSIITKEYGSPEVKKVK